MLLNEVSEPILQFENIQDPKDPLTIANRRSTINIPQPDDLRDTRYMDETAQANAFGNVYAAEESYEKDITIRD